MQFVRSHLRASLVRRCCPKPTPCELALATSKRMVIDSSAHCRYYSRFFSSFSFTNGYCQRNDKCTRRRLFSSSTIHERLRPQNDLEESLQKATKDPSHLPQFIRDLLKSQVYFLGKQDPKSGKLQLLQADRPAENGLMKSFQIFFTSPDRLQEIVSSSMAEEHQNKCFSCTGKMLFEQTRGSYLVLTAGNLQAGKEFYPSEVEEILNDEKLGGGGGGGEPGVTPEKRTLDAGATLAMGEPKKWPKEMVDAFVRLFDNQTNKAVEKAYLRWVVVVKDGLAMNTKNEGTYFLGLVLKDGLTDEEEREVMRGIGGVVQKHPGPFVDVTILEEGSNVFDAIRRGNKGPIYDRAGDRL